MVKIEMGFFNGGGDSDNYEGGIDGESDASDRYQLSVCDLSSPCLNHKVHFLLL